MLLGLRTWKIVAKDLARAKEWYSQVVGHGPYFDEVFYVGFEVGGFELGIVPQEGSDRPGVNGAVAYWGVEDADAAYARLVELGATPHEPVTDVGGGIRLGTVLDPDGNVLGIIHNPHFGGGEG